MTTNLKHSLQYQAYLTAAARVAAVTGHKMQLLDEAAWTQRTNGAAIEDQHDEADTIATSSPMLDAAKIYAELLPGRLLPCLSGGKRPNLPDWPTKASRSESMLTKWFHGDANMGFVPDSRVFVLDLDRKADKDGFASLAALESEFGNLPETLTATTPSGGQHRYFRGYNLPFRTQADACKLSGVDIRAGGASAGFVVMPPSQTATGIYAWHNWDMVEAPSIAEAPRWLQELACGKDPRKAATATPTDASEADHEHDERIAHLKDALTHISAEDYDQWIAVGHALKSLDDDAGKPLFMEWSATSEQFDRRECEEKWAGFKPNATSYRTVFSMAQAGGWINPGVATPLRPEAVEETGIAPGALLIKTKDGHAYRATSHMRDLVAPVLKARFAYSQDAATWHRWTGTHWEADNEGATFKKALHDVVEVGTFPKGFGTSHVSSISSLIRDGQTLPLIEVEGNLLPFQNGLLDLDNKSLSPVSPSRALTWSLPYEYAPDADCPNIRAWLLDAMHGDKHMVQYLRAWMAAILTGRADLHTFFYLKGPGGTGKSTFQRLVSAMVGHHNVFATDLRNLECNRFEPAGAYGKRLVIIGDAAKYGGSIEVLKQLTGQDPVRLERKGEQQRGSFVYGGCVLIASNEDLVTADLTSGLDRRRAVVEFDRVVTGDQKEQWAGRGGEQAVLHAEMPGLINWLLALSPAEVKHLVLNPPERAKESNKGAMLANNPVARWLEQCCVPDSGEHTIIGQCKERPLHGRGSALRYENAETELYPNYLVFAEADGVHALSRSRFKATLLDACRTLNYPVENKKLPGDGRDCIKGLALIPPPL